MPSVANSYQILKFFPKTARREVRCTQRDKMEQGGSNPHPSTKTVRASCIKTGRRAGE
jgi:hypothetical protein